MGGGAELVLVFIIPNNASSHQSPALDTVDTGAKTGLPTTILGGICRGGGAPSSDSSPWHDVLLDIQILTT